MSAILTRFRAFCVSSFPLVAFALVVANFITCCSVSRSCHPQYVYSTIATTNYISEVITNYLSSPLYSTNSINIDTKELKQNSPPSFNVSYQYFVIGDSPTIKMNGVYYREGQVCSKGIILRIFPDTVYLHNGSTLSNTFAPRDFAPRDNEFSSVRRSPDSLISKKRGFTND